MTILAVDNEAEKLVRMDRLLCDIFPEDKVLLQNDPLLAAKYSFTHTVDMLFAAAELKPIGFKLNSFVRRTNPEALIFLIARPGQSVDGMLYKNDVDGLIKWPMTRRSVLGAIKDAKRKIGFLQENAE